LIAALIEFWHGRAGRQYAEACTDGSNADGGPPRHHLSAP
jgi:hypothetical protein